jgi:crotonobetainyl-CoA:carnitine CoA-transferase CaiB-like acyl-CoA transferase
LAQRDTALGFYEELETIGLGDLGVVVDSNDKRDELLSTLDACFACGHRDHWVKILRETDIVAAPINTLLEASNDPDVLANGYVTEIEYPEFGKTAKMHGPPGNFPRRPRKSASRRNSANTPTRYWRV